MSSSFHSKMSKVDPVAYEGVEAVFGIEKEQKKLAAAESEQSRLLRESEAANAAAAERLKVKQVGTREQDLRQAASAAGATRSGNEQDFLSGGRPRARRRYASQELLG